MYNARNHIHRKTEKYLAYHKETAQRIDGEQIQFIFHLFLGKKRTK